MTTTFESQVLEKLSSIEERLTGIEDRFEEATSFADGILGEEGGIFGEEGLNTIKKTLSTFMTPEALGETSNLTDGSPESLQDLVGSLKDFRDRLSGIKAAISSLPEEEFNLVDEEEE
jgi:hypothetical protein